MVGNAAISLSNADVWISSVYRWAGGVEIGLAGVVRDEVKEVLKLAMQFTPPKSLAQGRAAVGRDILKTMRPLTEDEITRSKPLARVIAAGDVERFNAMTAYLPVGSPLRNARAGDFDPAFHTRQQDGRMRVSDRAQVTIMLGRKNAGLLSAYIKTVQSHVGFAKAGWWPALRVAGGDAPDFVTRHADAAGSAVDNIATADGKAKEMFILVVNRTGWGAREGARILNDALRIRARIIERRMREGVMAASAGGGPVRPR